MSIEKEHTQAVTEELPVDTDPGPVPGEPDVEAAVGQEEDTTSDASLSTPSDTESVTPATEQDAAEGNADATDAGELESESSSSEASEPQSDAETAEEEASDSEEAEPLGE